MEELAPGALFHRARGTRPDRALDRRSFMSKINIYLMPADEKKRDAAGAPRRRRRGVRAAWARGARVHAIVRRARVSERMIYHHFGSKDGLYRAVLEDQWSGLIEGWRPALRRRRRSSRARGSGARSRCSSGCSSRARCACRSRCTKAMSGRPRRPRRSRCFHRNCAISTSSQASGVFRRDCDFELLYCTVVGALAGIGIFGPRFSDLRARLSCDLELAARLGEQTVGLVLDGVTTPGWGGRAGAETP